MSTPIKPTGDASSAGGLEAPEGAGGGSVERADGKFGDLIDEARGEARVAEAERLPALRGLEQDLVAGRASVEEAIDHLVRRALAGASDLSLEHRAALESQLRDALDGDPTLAALKKDLQRAAPKG